MSNNVIFDSNNASVKNLTEAERKEKERLRAINTERIHRWRQRKKLKTAVADFINRLQLYTANHLDKNTMTVINVSLRNILHLRPHWTQKDLHLAFNSLRSLERRYLGQARSKVPDEKFALQNKITKEIFTAKLNDEEQLEVALGVLDVVAKKFAVQAQSLAPTREHTLALLTQNLANGIPDWFTKALISLLSTKYAGEDLLRVLELLQKTLREKKQLMEILAEVESSEEE